MVQKIFNIIPIRYHSRKRLYSNKIFWILLFTAIFPLLIAISKSPDSILYIFSIYVNVLWLIVFISFFTKKNQEIVPIISIFIFTVLIVFPILIFFNNVLYRIIPSIQNPKNNFEILLNQILFVAAKEEIFKILPIFIFAYFSFQFHDPLDGLILGIGSGLGFAAFENIMYLNNISSEFFKGIYTVNQMLFQAITRIITLCCLHSLFSGISGYYIGVFKFTERRSIFVIIYGLIISILLHGFYNFFVIKYITAAIIIAILTFVIFMNIYLRESEYLISND